MGARRGRAALEATHSCFEHRLHERLVWNSCLRCLSLHAVEEVSWNSRARPRRLEASQRKAHRRARRIPRPTCLRDRPASLSRSPVIPPGGLATCLARVNRERLLADGRPTRPQSSLPLRVTPTTGRYVLSLRSSAAPDPPTVVERFLDLVTGDSSFRTVLEEVLQIGPLPDDGPTVHPAIRIYDACAGNAKCIYLR